MTFVVINKVKVQLPSFHLKQCFMSKILKLHIHGFERKHPPETFIVYQLCAQMFHEFHCMHGVIHEIYHCATQYNTYWCQKQYGGCFFYLSYLVSNTFFVFGSPLLFSLWFSCEITVSKRCKCRSSPNFAERWDVPYSPVIFLVKTYIIHSVTWSVTDDRCH